MRLGKLRDLVASNFIEIKRDETHEEVRTLSVAPAAPPVAESVVAIAPATETVPATVAEIDPDPLQRPAFVDALKSDGELDPEIVFGAHRPAPVAFTAEQAVDVLRDLPDNAQPHDRYRAMRSALATFDGRVESIAPQVVADAAQKMVGFNRFLGETVDAAQAYRGRIGDEILRLHEEINRLRELLDDTNGVYDVLNDSVRKRVDHMTGIIAFFDEFQAMYKMEQAGTLPSEFTQSPDAEDQIMPFMRDEHVMKFLGVRDKPEARAA